MQAVQVENVVKKFPSITAVDGVSFSIEAGECVALLGPNGAGKTTLIEMLEGIQDSDSGTITLLGHNWKDHAPTLRRKIGLALQETRFLEKATVWETLSLFCSFYRLPVSRAEEILEITNLKSKEKAFVSHLSGGQRQRLALGISILNEPEILFLDEPTTGLDPNARREIWNFLELLKSKGTTLLLTTHYMEEAEYLCDRIIIMYGGKILARGTLTELLKQAGGGEFVRFRLQGGKNPRKELKHLTYKEFNFDPVTRQGEFVVDSIVEFLPKLSTTLKKVGYELEDLECRKKTLDDLFLSLTGVGLSDETVISAS